VTTVHHYSAAADRPANRAFVAAWQKEYGAETQPNFVAAASWDAMAAIVHVIKQQNGKLDGERSMALFKAYKTADSPRGPIAIDPATRDIVQNEYLREVRRANGRLANIEIETVAAAMKDPWKERQKR
jgi:branched-chain amino acid transport system substrate-binding protein